MLRPDTERVWRCLEHQSALAGFVLVGGSALALRIAHRVSEDLDFAWTEARLPRARLDALLHASQEHGLHLCRHDDPAAADEFEIAGMSLPDYQQDFLVDDRVKVSFFTADEPLCLVLNEPPSSQTVRIATLDELFASKCLIGAARSKSRDWFDLYTLMREHGFTMAQFHAVFVEAGIPGHYDIAIGRLCTGHPSLSDEGFEHLTTNAPSLEQMRNFFTEQREAFERSEARRVSRDRRAGL